MNDTKLRELLRRADDAYEPAVASDLPRRVHQLRRRRDRRSAIALIATPLIVILGFLVWPTHQASRVVISSPESATLPLRTQFHELSADRMQAAERRAREHQRSLALAAHASPLSVIDAQRERAAMTLVQLARRYPPQDFAQEYERVVRLFPDTHGAALARQRLSELDRGKEG